MKKLFTKRRLILPVLFISGFLWLSFSPDLFEVSKDLEIFSSVFREINANYVDETKPGDLMKRALDAMLYNLDPYTNYIPESEIEDYRFMTTGQYGGVGASIRKRDDYVMISEPYEGFPAQISGLLAGDLILEVDGKSVKGKSTEEVSKVLKGQPGTVVKLKITREGEQEKEFSLTRQEIKVKSVPFSGFIQDSVGYILLSSFTEDCSGEIKKAYNEMNGTGKLKALILDLRGNPGGLLYESVNIANFFIDKGEIIVKTRGRVQEWEKSYKGLNPPLSVTIPLVVLVNGGSASASEIVAGSIQDFDRGVIIGQRTFGKGLVQTTRNISYNSKLKVTTAKYYTPSGRCIQALDYSHRGEDGSVEKVPDSLTQSFLTKSGRKVFDGGGINPDLITPERKPSGIALALERNFEIFDFASSYYRRSSKLIDLRQFSLDEKEVGAFVKEMSGSQVDFEIFSDKAVTQLKEEIKEEGYEGEFKTEMEKLRNEIAVSESSAINQNSNELKQRLESEIVGRYFFQRGRIEYNLRHDPEIDTALSILNNIPRYQSLLSGSSSKK